MKMIYNRPTTPDSGAGIPTGTPPRVISEENIDLPNRHDEIKILILL